MILDCYMVCYCSIEIRRFSKNQHLTHEFRPEYCKRAIFQKFCPFSAPIIRAAQIKSDQIRADYVKFKSCTVQCSL